MKTHYWKIKGIILPHILDGSKDLELRVGHYYVKLVQVGDIIIFNGQCGRKVVAIRDYPDFSSAVEKEDHSRIFPGRTKKWLLAKIKENFTAESERLGVLIFELGPC